MRLVHAGHADAAERRRRRWPPVARSTSTLHGSPRDPLPDLASASPRPTASSTSSRGSGRAPGFNDFTDSIRPPVCRTKDTAAGAISCTMTAMCASADAPTPAAARVCTASGVNSDAHTAATASATAAQLLAWTPTTLTCPPHPAHLRRVVLDAGRGPERRGARCRLARLEETRAYRRGELERAPGVCNDVTHGVAGALDVRRGPRRVARPPRRLRLVRQPSAAFAKPRLHRAERHHDAV